MSMNLVLSQNKVRISVFVLVGFFENTNYPECVALTQDVKHETELDTSSYAILNLWLC